MHRGLGFLEHDRQLTLAAEGELVLQFGDQMLAMGYCYQHLFDAAEQIASSEV